MSGFAIRVTESAKSEIRGLKAAHRKLVLDAIRLHLSARPNVEEGAKKVLRGLLPPWNQVRPVWQLTAVPFRIFYDVDAESREVIINAVRAKTGGKKTEDIL